MISVFIINNIFLSLYTKSIQNMVETIITPQKTNIDMSVLLPIDYVGKTSACAFLY
jgi:hypothetical protein